MIWLKIGRSIVPPETLSSCGWTTTSKPFLAAHSWIASSCTSGLMNPSPPRSPTFETRT